MQRGRLARRARLLRLGVARGGRDAPRAGPHSGVRLFCIKPLKLQIAIDEVVLLETAEALADVAGPGGSDSLHGLEVAL
jgi:hypothetical protein